MNYEPAVACGLPKKAVYEFAEEVSSSLKFAPGDDLQPYVYALHGKVRVVPAADLTNSRDGSIIIEPDGRFEIVLADDIGPPRNRFTIAHELGHLFLHMSMRKSATNGLKAARYGTGPVEWEANWFAAAFLMPSALFIQAHTDTKGNISEMASLFAVSLQSASIRAGDLGLAV